MIVSIVVSLSHCALDILATGKQVNHRDGCEVEISTNLQSLRFRGSEKAIELAKK